MAIAGTFGEFDLAGVLQMLQGQRASGRLLLNDGGAQAELVLAKGMLFDCLCEGIGINTLVLRYLTFKGCEVPPAWNRHGARSGAGLVARAVEAGLLQQDEATQLHRMLLVDLSTQLFLWDRAQFRFLPEEIQALGVAVGVDELTLEAMRRADDLPRFQAEYPDDTVLERKVDLERFPRKEGEPMLHHPARHVLELLDGVSTIAELAGRSWLCMFRLREALHLLGNRDWIEAADSDSVHEAIEEQEASGKGLWRVGALLGLGAIVWLALAVAMRGPSLPAFLGTGDPSARVRLELRERGARTWDRAQEGRAPVGMAMPDSY